MKKILASLLLALVIPASSVDLSSFHALPATYDCAGSGALSGSWTKAFGSNTVERATGVCAPTSNIDNTVYFWNADAFPDDQYAQIYVAGAVVYYGAAVRASSASGGSAYWATVLDTNIYKTVNGTGPTDIGDWAGTINTGDTVKMTAVGVNPTTITVYINGVSAGVTTDSDLDSGSAGFVMYNGSLDDFEGGSVGGGASSFIPAIINAPVRGGGKAKWPHSSR